MTERSTHCLSRSHLSQFDCLRLAYGGGKSTTENRARRRKHRGVGVPLRSTPLRERREEAGDPLGSGGSYLGKQAPGLGSRSRGLGCWSGVTSSPSPSVGVAPACPAE